MVYVQCVRGLGVDELLWEDQGKFFIVLFKMSVVYLNFDGVACSVDIRLDTFFTLCQGLTIIFLTVNKLCAIHFIKK